MGYWGGHGWSGAGGNIADIDRLIGVFGGIDMVREGIAVVDLGLQSGANSSWFGPAEWGQQ